MRTKIFGLAALFVALVATAASAATRISATVVHSASKRLLAGRLRSRRPLIPVPLDSTTHRVPNDLCFARRSDISFCGV
jgi:hypothetical protein